MPGLADKIKYYNIFDQLPQYQYCNDNKRGYYWHFRRILLTQVQVHVSRHHPDCCISLVDFTIQLLMDSTVVAFSDIVFAQGI